MITNIPFFYTGHRGCRGLMPENTIPGFIKALELGVNAIELDVVISKDKKVVVSHEPFMNSLFCLDADGKSFSEEEEKKYNLYEMNYEEIRKFDCGSKIHPLFLKQQKLKTEKPLLKDVIKAIEKYREDHELADIVYDIEIKSEHSGYNISQPVPVEFVELLMDCINKIVKSENLILRSFDPKPLQYLHTHYPDIALSLIVENKLSIPENIDILGFNPYMYSPEYVHVSPEMIHFGKKHNIKIVPWTVNTKEEINQLVKIGVDGIITDYPDLFEKVKS